MWPKENQNKTQKKKKKKKSHWLDKDNDKPTFFL